VFGQSTVSDLNSNSQLKVRDMVYIMYHQRLLFWVFKATSRFGPAPQKLLEYFTDKLTKFYFHIS
jgi:hypothetical protein